MKNLVNTALVAGLMAATPAHAADFVVNMTGPGTTTSANADGNVRTYKATSGTSTLDVRATGWSLAGDGIVRDSYLGSYSAGLGVTSGDENGSNNTHVVDNQNRRDFVLLQFSQAVTLTSAVLNAFNVSGLPLDTDALVAWGGTPGAWNAALPFNNTGVGALGSLLDGGLTSLGNGSSGTRNFAVGNATGNLWLIGAAFDNADRRVDGFKLASISAKTVAAVPEPATWAMMLVGFGAVGFAMRRRQKVTTRVQFA